MSVNDFLKHVDEGIDLAEKYIQSEYIDSEDAKMYLVVLQDLLESTKEYLTDERALDALLEHLVKKYPLKTLKKKMENFQPHDKNYSLLGFSVEDVEGLWVDFEDEEYYIPFTTELGVKVLQTSYLKFDADRGFDWDTLNFYIEKIMKEENNDSNSQ